MRHRHKKPVFGCKECIDDRGPVYKSLIGTGIELRRKLVKLNYKLEKHVPDKLLDDTITFMGELDSFVEVLYNEAEIIQNRRHNNNGISNTDHYAYDFSNIMEFDKS